MHLIHQSSIEATVTIVIVTWRSLDLLRDCLDSIRETGESTALSVVVVDNASGDGTAEALERDYPWVDVVQHGENRGFAAGNNLALRSLASDFAYLLNPDTLVRSGYVDQLVDYMRANPDCGTCAPRIVARDGTPMTTYGDFPTPASAVIQQLGSLERARLLRRWSRVWGRPAPQGPEPIEADYVCGAAMMIRQSALEDVGLMSEDYFLFFEEVDWCFRAAARGWRRTVVPSASIVHLEGGTMADAPGRRTRAYYDSLGVYLSRWYGRRAARLTLRTMSLVWKIRGLRFRVLGNREGVALAAGFSRLFREVGRDVAASGSR